MRNDLNDSYGTQDHHDGNPNSADYLDLNLCIGSSGIALERLKSHYEPIEKVVAVYKYY